MNRRDFLFLSTAAAIVPLALRSAAAESGSSRLVVILLRGAVDGLNVVIPYGEEAYYAGRPSIAVPRPGMEGGGLALDQHFALHPALGALLPLWEEKKLAFVHASGSPDPTRSHFDAQLFIENGTPGRRVTEDGWINRLLAALPGPRGPADALAIGPTLPFILKGKTAAANLPLGPAATRKSAIDRPEVADAFDRLYAGDDDDPVGRAYRTGRAARTELAASINSEQQMADNGAPPANNFPAQAAQLARLLSRDHRIRITFAALGGWDTHVQEGNHQGQLANRLRPLGDGLAALARGLGQGWADTAVVVLSEFGRTVRENGDGGTDHGHGNVAWILGGPVHGGRVYGEWPGLAPAALYEGRDLAVTTDYRTILAAVIGRHMRQSDNTLAEVFPGFTPARSEVDRIIA